MRSQCKIFKAQLKWNKTNIVIVFCSYCIPDEYTNSEINLFIANGIKQTRDRKDGCERKEVRKEVTPSIFGMVKNREYEEQMTTEALEKTVAGKPASVSQY